MMLRAHTLTVLLLFCICCQAQFSATYGFVGVAAGTGTTDPSNVPLVTGLKLGSFNAVNLSSNPTASGRFAFSGWPVGAVNGVDDPLQFTGDLSGLNYYEVKIYTLPGFTLQLNSVLFHVRRSSTGIRNYCLRSDRDNFLDNLSASTGTNTNLSVLPGNIFFWMYDSLGTSADQKGCQVICGADFSKITDSVTFRFYAWNAEAGSGSFSLDNVSFSGVVYSPDPLGIDGWKMDGDHPGKCYVFNLDGQQVWSGDEALLKQASTYLDAGLYFLRSEHLAGPRKILVEAR